MTPPTGTDSSIPDDRDRDRIVEDKLNADLGMDVAFVEQQVRFRLDLERMKRGEPGDLGYVFIKRRDHPHAVVVFDDPDAAEAALADHPLVESLATEDSTNVYVKPVVDHADLVGKEIVLP